MKIDKEKLKEILSEKTDLSPGEIEKQLNDLIARIRETAEKGKALEIKGFGLFYLSKSGQLEFDPSEDFSTEVNYRYAGMEPVEISASENAGAELPEEPSEFGKDKKAPEPVESDSGTEKSSGTPGVPVSRKKRASGSEKRTAAADRRTRDPVSRKKKEWNSVMTLIITVIMIILLASILMLVMDRPEAGHDSGDEQVAESAEPEEEGLEDGEILDLEGIGPETDVPEFSEGRVDALDENETSDEGPDEEQVEQEPSGTTVVQETEELFGLYGDNRNLDDRYYSIILYALQSRVRAENVEEELKSEGYRTVVTETNHEEHGRLWRVGVGQFVSIPDAQEAASELPGTYRENHFIGRIQ